MSEILKGHTGQTWQIHSELKDQRRALLLEQDTNLEPMARLVMQRQNISPEELTSYINPTLRTLCPDPHTLKDMAKAIERISQALETGERIHIFGDYDVDGAASTALMVSTLEAFQGERRKARITYQIPERLTDGYGPSVNMVEKAAKQKTDLLICLDCGTTGFEALQAAQTTGLDVIVIDHHQSAEALPPATAIVNPNRNDDLSGQGHLCAAGVVFLTMIALRRHLIEKGWAHIEGVNLLNKLDLVALATVADVVPLQGVNRAFVKQGLEIMRRRNTVGLAALNDVSGLTSPPTTYHLGFVFGPRINAGGRIGEARKGTTLLLSRDMTEALTLAKELDQLNKERRTLEDRALKQALEDVEVNLIQKEWDENRPIIVRNESWHIGIVGLIAARLKEKYKRPAIALGLNGEIWSGSARSIGGVDIGKAIQRCCEQGALIKGGGHAMAAGMSIAKDKIDEAITTLQTELTKAYDAGGDHVERHTSFDGMINSGVLTLEAINELDEMGPFGSGNSNPIFLIHDLTLETLLEIKAEHLKAVFKTTSGTRIEGMLFYGAGTPLHNALKQRIKQHVSIWATPEINTFRGQSKPQLLIRDILA